MAVQYVVITNISAGEVVLDNKSILPAGTLNLDRKRFVVAKYPPGEYDAMTMLSEVSSLITGGYVTASYNGKALTVAELGNLDALDEDAGVVHWSYIDFESATTTDITDHIVVPAKCKLEAMYYWLKSSVTIVGHAANFVQFVITNLTGPTAVSTYQQLVANGDVAQYETSDEFTLASPGVYFAEKDVLKMVMTKENILSTTFDGRLMIKWREMP